MALEGRVDRAGGVGTGSMTTAGAISEETSSFSCRVLTAASRLHCSSSAWPDVVASRVLS